MPSIEKITQNKLSQLNSNCPVASNSKNIKTNCPDTSNPKNIKLF